MASKLAYFQSPGIPGANPSVSDLYSCVACAYEFPLLLVILDSMHRVGETG